MRGSLPALVAVALSTSGCAVLNRAEYSVVIRKPAHRYRDLSEREKAVLAQQEKPPVPMTGIDPLFPGGPGPVPPEAEGPKVPAGRPDVVVTKLNAEINEIMKEKEAREKLGTIGFEAIVKTRTEAAEYFKSEIATWGRMTRAIGFSN